VLSARQPDPVAEVDAAYSEGRRLREAALEEHRTRRQVWESKYAIRACYQGWFDRLRPFIVSGPSVEIGAGTGHVKSFWLDLIETDVVATPWVDLVADGMRLPFMDASLSNLLVIDLLHHLADPHAFFDEAARVLRPGGRVLAIEPYITPLSWVGYRLLHHEDVYFGGYHRGGDKSDPWAGNLAVPNLLFGRERREWPHRHPSLRIVHLRRFSLFDFQLAGGFKSYAFIGRRWLYDRILQADRLLEWLAPVTGFRIFAVIERT
jgi:SAM-dependent methyltransferase